MTTSLNSGLKFLAGLTAALLLASQANADIASDLADGLTVDQAVTNAQADGLSLEEIAEALYLEGQSISQVTQALINTGADANAVATALVSTEASAPSPVDNFALRTSLNAAGVAQPAPAIAFAYANATSRPSVIPVGSGEEPGGEGAGGAGGTGGVPGGENDGSGPLPNSPSQPVGD